jgi:hypothetical protein
VVLKPNADAGGLNFALALPPVHLAGGAKQEFKTVGIMVHNKGRVRNPAGAALTYEVVPLKGIAEDIPIL